MDHASEPHRHARSAWLRAAVLGANDGIVSIGAMVVGLASGGATSLSVLEASVAAALGGALSMAAGEYVSVATQRDLERADIAIETREHEADPDGEVQELADIWQARGLSEDLAREVAEALHRGDALEAHLRDELGIDRNALADPWLAAGVSFTAFALGSTLPIATASLWPGPGVPLQVGTACLLALAITGALSSWLGGAEALRGAARVTMGGGAAMALTWGLGSWLGTPI